MPDKPAKLVRNGKGGVDSEKGYPIIVPVFARKNAVLDECAGRRRGWPTRLRHHLCSGKKKANSVEGCCPFARLLEQRYTSCIAIAFSVRLKRIGFRNRQPPSRLPVVLPC